MYEVWLSAMQESAACFHTNLMEIDRMFATSPRRILSTLLLAFLPQLALGQSYNQRLGVTTDAGSTYKYYNTPPTKQQLDADRQRLAAENARLNASREALVGRFNAVNNAVANYNRTNAEINARWKQYNEQSSYFSNQSYSGGDSQNAARKSLQEKREILERANAQMRDWKARIQKAKEENSVIQEDLNKRVAALNARSQLLNQQVKDYNKRMDQQMREYNEAQKQWAAKRTQELMEIARQRSSSGYYSSSSSRSSSVGKHATSDY